MTNYCKSYFTQPDTIIYENVFTDEVKTFNINEPFSELDFQKQHNIKVSGEYTDKNVLFHIKALMSPNENGSQFTHIFIYYVCDGVVDCSVNLTSFALPLDMIIDFVNCLLVCADPDRRNEFTLEFTRPAFDCTEYTIETAR